MNCNVLYLAHETKLNGATKSLLNIIDTLPHEITAVVVVPRNDGPLIEELKKRAINYVYVKYYPCCFKEKMLKDNIVAYVKWFLYRKQVNNKAVKTLIGIVEEKNSYYSYKFWHYRLGCKSKRTTSTDCTCVAFAGIS